MQDWDHRFLFYVSRQSFPHICKQNQKIKCRALASENLWWRSSIKCVQTSNVCTNFAVQNSNGHLEKGALPVRIIDVVEGKKIRKSKCTFPYSTFSTVSFGNE